MATTPKFRFPLPSEHSTVIGRNGTGKTVLGLWLLSEANIESMPWHVINFKEDETINDIPYARDIGYGEMPKQPGVYILHAQPNHQDQVEAHLWKIWQRGRTGVFADEAYTMPNKEAYPSILIQGRSKQVPTINCSQRPSWVPGQVFSEASHYFCFHLNDKRDQRRINEFMPLDFDQRLPDYWSTHYRVKDDQRFHLQPVPSVDTLMATFARRLAPKRRIV